MVRRCRPLLGTLVEVIADDVVAIGRAFDAVEQAQALMSAHRPASDLGRVNRFAHLREVGVHPWTASVLDRALYWSRQSAGAFDVALAGKSALEQGLIPLHPDQPRPRASHWTCIELEGNSVRLLQPACIDLGGIAKGFAIDRAIAALKSAGARRGLVNAGGDLAGFGPHPWPVTIAEPESRRPLAEVALRNEALATSAILPGGDCRHLPGRNAGLSSASVRAASAMDADALTKIVLAGPGPAAPALDAVGAQAFTIGVTGDVRLIGRHQAAAA